MAQDIDFIMPTIQQIKIPSTKTQLPIRDNKKGSSKTFTIEKSFVPERKSTVHQKMRPEIEKIKMLLKAQRQKQKKIKQLIAQGKLERKDLEHPREEKKKQEAPKEKLMVDETGKLRDEKGNLVFMKNQTVDLKINQKKTRQNQQKQLVKKQKIKFHEKLSRNLQDKNLVVTSSKKRDRKAMFGLQFVEEDEGYSDSSEEEEIADLEEAVKQEPKIKHLRKRLKTNLNFNRDVPNIQWWDAQILDLEKLNKVKAQNPEEQTLLNEFVDISKLSEPVTFQRVGSQQKKESKINIPIYLTKDERKKLKRKKKREKLIEKNDMIRLGLIEPDKPRLKISNMAIVHKNQFIMDPSKIEKMAKDQAEERLNKHLETNQSRKLTRAQKKDKIIRKLKRDSAKECRRIIFKLKKLENPSHCFKVNMNARQLALNGFILKPNQYHRQNVLIVGEGGQKAIKFMKNLMMNRIKWEQDENECRVIWQGQIESSKIGKWRTFEVGDQLQTSKVLKEKNLDNFYEFIA